MIGFLEAQTLAFYRSVQIEGNITKAFESTLKQKMLYYNCQGIFAEALANYIRTNCKVKGKKQRLEKLVTQNLEAQSIVNPTSSQLRETRNELRLALEPSQKIIDYYAPNFLIGRPARFDYDDLKKLVESL